MVTKGFTKISNSVMLDYNLSIEALGLYVKIVYYNAIPNFKLNREFIKKLSGYGDTAFRRVWKELKDKGVINQIKTIESGRFGAEYILNTTILIDEPKEQDETAEEIKDTEDIKEIKNETNFNSKQANDLLKISDVRTIINYFRYVKSKGKEVKNLFAYTKKLIVDRIDVKQKNIKKVGWSNYDQRDYTKEDWINIENKLLGWA